MKYFYAGIVLLFTLTIVEQVEADFCTPFTENYYKIENLSCEGDCKKTYVYEMTNTTTVPQW